MGTTTKNSSVAYYAIFILIGGSNPFSFMHSQTWCSRNEILDKKSLNVIINLLLYDIKHGYAIQQSFKFFVENSSVWGHRFYLILN